MRCTITVWSGRIIFRFQFLLLLHNDFWPTHHPCLHIYNYQRFMKSNNSLVKKPTKNNFWETFPEWFVTLFPFIHIPETGNAEGRQKSWSIYQYQIIFSDIIFEFDKSVYINCNDNYVFILLFVLFWIRVKCLKLCFWVGPFHPSSSALINITEILTKSEKFQNSSSFPRIIAAPYIVKYI